VAFGQKKGKTLGGADSIHRIQQTVHHMSLEQKDTHNGVQM